jgi:transposase
MTATVPELTIGLDLGDNTFSVCVLSNSGHIENEGTHPTNPDEVRALFESFRGRHVRVVFEVGSQSRWVQKLARECGIEDVIAADPRKLKLISQSLKKTDRRDAYILARAGQSLPELLSPVEHVSDEIFADRALLETRDLLVRNRTQIICRIRSLTKAHGGKLAACSPESFHRKVTEQIPEPMHFACKPLLQVLAALDQQISELEKSLCKLAKEKYPIVAKLQDIPGVGIIIALSFVLSVGDPSRFEDTRQIGAYFGLTPRKKQSGNSNPQLGITKAGNGAMRKRLVLGAHCLISRGEDCGLKRWGIALCERGARSSKKRAVIALARKLAVVMLAVWKSGADFDPWRGVPIPERMARVA